MWKNSEVSLWFRLTGALLLTAAGWMTGQCRLWERKRMVRLLRELSCGLGIMEDELSSLRSPLPLLLDKLKDYPFFGELRRNFGAAPLPELWKATAEAEALELPAEARPALAALGEIVGRYDAERQAAELQTVRRRLDRLAEAAEAEIHGRDRNFASLGAALGAMLAVLLL